MHFYLLFFIFLTTISFFTASAQGNKKTVKRKHRHAVNTVVESADSSKVFIISGRVLQTSSYCGGVAPSHEILEKAATPVAYSGKKFYIREGNTNTLKNKIIGSFTIDSIGKFSVKLHSGTYSVIQEEQVHLLRISDYINPNQQVDTNCLKNWWAAPYALLVVKDKNITDLNFTFHHQCFIADIPCIMYVGPMPP